MQSAVSDIAAPGGGRHPASRSAARWLPWTLGLLIWGAAAIALARLSITAIIHPPYMIDLNVYRTAGHQVLSGSPVYAKVPKADLPQLGRSLLVFTYPPVSALLAVPLALVSKLIAQVAWVAAVYVPLAVLVAIAFRPLLERAGRYGAAVAGLVFFCCLWLFPMLQQIRYGQVDILLAALCLADLAVRRPRWPRGLLIGIAAAVKLTPAVFIIYLLLTGRRRAALVATATMAGFTLAAWAIIPSSSAYYWTTAVFDSSRLGPNAQIANQSVRAMLLRALPHGAAPAVIWVALAVLLGAAAFALARRASARGNDVAGAAIVGLLAILISPVSWIHHLIWVIVAIGAILGDGRGWRGSVTAAGATAFFVLASPYQGSPRSPAPAGSWFKLLWQDSYGLAAAALLVVLAVLPRARPSPLPAEPGPPEPPAAPQAPVPVPYVAAQRSAPPAVAGPASAGPKDGVLDEPARASR